MGYCNYYPAGNGNWVAMWIGTGTDKGKVRKVIYLPRSGDGTKLKSVRCADARRQFCIQETGHPNCTPKGESLISRQLSGNKFPEEIREDEKKRTDAIKKSNDCLDICKRECGPDPRCHFAKWDCGCGGSFNFGGLCETIPLPPPFNDCLVLGGLAIGAILIIMVAK